MLIVGAFDQIDHRVLNPVTQSKVAAKAPAAYRIAAAL